MLAPGIHVFLGLAKGSIAYAISIVFTASMALAGCALVLFYLVEERDLRTSQAPEDKAPENSPTTAPTEPVSI
jgi:hypothetical protein